MGSYHKAVFSVQEDVMKRPIPITCCYSYSTSACVATNNCHKAVIDVPDMRCDRSVSPTIISGRAPRPSQPDFIAAV